MRQKCTVVKEKVLQKCKKLYLYSIFFNGLYDKKSTASVKKLLDLWGNGGIIPDGKAQILNKIQKKGATMRPEEIRLARID